MANWRYKLHEEFRAHSRPLIGVEFKNDWVELDGKGLIVIPKDYAWDGMSPTLYIKPADIWLGPWQGRRDDKLPHLPYTWRASLIHDVLCQFKHEIPIMKFQTVIAFADELDRVRFPLKSIYVAAVDKFGPQRFAGDE